MRASSRMVFLVSWILECNHMADTILSGSHMVTRVEEKWFCAVSGKVLSHCGTGKSSSAFVQPGMEAVWNVAWESSGMWDPVELVWDWETNQKHHSREPWTGSPSRVTGGEDFHSSRAGVSSLLRRNERFHRRVGKEFMYMYYIPRLSGQFKRTFNKETAQAKLPLSFEKC